MVQTKITDFISSDVPSDKLEYLIKLLTLCRSLILFKRDKSLSIVEKEVVVPIEKTLQEYEEYLFTVAKHIKGNVLDRTTILVLYGFKNGSFILLDINYDINESRIVELCYSLFKNNNLTYTLSRKFNKFFNIYDFNKLRYGIIYDYDYVFETICNKEFHYTRQHFNYNGLLPIEIINYVLKDNVNRILLSVYKEEVEYLRKNNSKLRELCFKILDVIKQFFNIFTSIFNNLVNVNNHIVQIEKQIKDTLSRLNILNVYILENAGIIRIFIKEIDAETVKLLGKLIDDEFSFDNSVCTVTFYELTGKPVVELGLAKYIFKLINERGLSNSIENFVKHVVTYKILSELYCNDQDFIHN